jgi:hypothetical protein
MYAVNPTNMVPTDMKATGLISMVTFSLVIHVGKAIGTGGLLTTKRSFLIISRQKAFQFPNVTLRDFSLVSSSGSAKNHPKWENPD